MAYRAILCDLGGVMVDLEADRLIHQVSQLIGRSFDEVHDTVYDPELLLPLETGRITPETYHEGLCTRLGLTWTFPQFARAWNDVLGKRPLMNDLFSRLRKTHTLVALTNTNSVHLEHIRSFFGLSEIFHDWVASCEVGFRKPDAEIYAMALEKAGVKANEVLYVDDRPEMIEGGRAAGLKAFRFKAVDSFKQELVNLGIL